MNKEEIVTQWMVTRARIEAIPFPANVGALVDRAAATFGDKLAWSFFERGETLSFLDVQALSLRCAAMMEALGIGRGSHVGVMVTNGPAYLGTWLGLARLGGTIVPINTRYTAGELAYVLNNSDADLLVIDSELLPVLEQIDPAARRLGPDRVIVVGAKPEGYPYAWEDLLDRAAAQPATRYVPTRDDPLNVQYTSGTTGFPKGCLLPHRYWLNAAVVWGEYLAFDLQNVLCNQNLFYLDGQFLAMVCLWRGASYHLCSTPSAKKFAGWLKRFHIDCCFYFDPLYQAPPIAGEADNDLKLLHIFGFNKERHAALEQRYNTIAREAFGMSEFAPSLMMPLNADAMVGSGSCGLVAPFTEARVVDDTGTDVKHGQSGELWVRSAAIMQGYYGNPEASRAALADGWLKTGDLFRQDESGFFYIVGRKKDMVRRNAENIACREVEATLRLMPGIKEAAVVPVKDDVMGEEVKAYILLQPGNDRTTVPPEAIYAFCRGHLAPFKVPRYLEYRDTFPMTDSSRVEKQKLMAESDDLRRNSFDRIDQLWR